MTRVIDMVRLKNADPEIVRLAGTTADSPIYEKAELVYRSARAQVEREFDPEKDLNVQYERFSHLFRPGHIWHGYLVELLELFWPTESPKTYRSLTTSISLYNRSRGNLIALHARPSSSHIKSTYYVADEWNTTPGVFPSNLSQVKPKFLKTPPVPVVPVPEAEAAPIQVPVIDMSFLEGLECEPMVAAPSIDPFTPPVQATSPTSPTVPPKVRTQTPLNPYAEHIFRVLRRYTDDDGMLTVVRPDNTEVMIWLGDVND